MNENAVTLRLRDFMKSSHGWGRSQGREVYGKLLDYVESHSGVLIFRVSMEDVERVDISFASETLVELASRYRSRKGFCFVDLEDIDMIENWEAAAERKKQPLMLWKNGECQPIGVRPSQGNLEAYNFALRHGNVRAAEFAQENPEVNIQNASMKFKQLWEKGFLLRRENIAGSGGVEFVYFSIG